jgi:pyridoxal phosphate enzyme (YggS family)
MVAEQLAAVRVAMSEAAARAGRSAADVTLVAVSKGRTTGEIMKAYEQGQRDFGENRAPELAEKAVQLPADIRWHFIGSLQTRQVKVARPHTHLLHSLDRPRLINAWSATGEAPPALVQVNVAAEPQKHGATPAEVRSLLEQARSAGLSCVGLMTMPPQVSDPEDNRRWFATLAEMRRDLSVDFPRLTHLSMGMTDDYTVAVEEGATLIRVGRAIFGEPGKD